MSSFDTALLVAMLEEGEERRLKMFFPAGLKKTQVYSSKGQKIKNTFRGISGLLSKIEFVEIIKVEKLSEDTRKSEHIDA